MHKVDNGWILGGITLIVLIVVALLINYRSSNTQTDKISETIAIDNGDLKINWKRYPTYDVQLSEPLTITESGTYRLVGELNNGAVNIKANHDTGKVRLILDNVTINNPSGPAIICNSADDLVIEISGENYLEDGKAYTSDYDEDVTGTIYSKDDLTFQGNGSLTVVSNYQDAIIGKDDLKFNSGIYYITAVDDGIRGKDSVYIASGTFDITTRGDGIRSTNNIDQGKGFVLIESGDIKINAGDDGIHAEQRLIIQGGKIAIEKSYEGLESKMIAISGGDISIKASDDGINAGGGSDITFNAERSASDEDKNYMITIDGGFIYVNAAGDGLDSNGYIYFNGGSVIVDGPTNNGNGALDAGAEININGGTVIAVGASGMASTLGENSAINNISVYFNTNLSAKTNISIKNSDDETVLQHLSAKSFNHLTAGSEKFKSGKIYSIYINGEKYTEFMISSRTTMVGDNINLNQNRLNTVRR